MLKNKIYNLIIFTSIVFVLFLSAVSFVKADNSLPDNVKITTSPDGASTTVIINSKPGFSTSVETNCMNGKCTHNASSVALTDLDIKKMKDNFKKEQETMDNFWKMQDDLFNQQQKMFHDLWEDTLL